MEVNVLASCCRTKGHAASDYISVTGLGQFLPLSEIDKINSSTVLTVG